MVKIAITTSSFDLGNLDARLQGHELVLNPHGRALTEVEAAALLADVTGVIAGVEPLNQAVLDAAPELAAIARVGTGLDTVDLHAAEDRGIAVSNTPDAPTDAVAELTVGLMLAVLRDIASSDAAVRSGEWPRTRGRLLGSCTVGLIGAGRIGRRVGQLVAGFGARVLFADPAVTAAELPGQLVSLEGLLAASDIVSLHVPLTADTRNLLTTERIAQMPSGAIVVNASRGGLLDEAALAAALRDGRLGGAALDVYDAEPYSGELISLPQVVLSPHVGSSTVETRQRMEREASSNLVYDLAAKGVL